MKALDRLVVQAGREKKTFYYNLISFFIIFNQILVNESKNDKSIFVTSSDEVVSTSAGVPCMEEAG